MALLDFQKVYELESSDEDEVHSHSENNYNNFIEPPMN
jgi:hypothetical protein